MGAERIVLDNQVLHGTDEFGKWTVNSIEGWWDSPEPKTDDVERPDADGDLDLPVRYKARYITINGSLKSPTSDTMFRAMNAFSGILANPGILSVQGYGVDQWADVRRASGISMHPRTDKYLKWQARVKAPDPRKYGRLRGPFVASVGSNAGGIFHRGNYPAIPQFVVDGNMPSGYVLTIKGLVFNVKAPLVPGHPHAIDYGTGRLYIDGLVKHGGVGWGFTPFVTPGDLTALSIAPPIGGSGTGTATLTLLDTYI